MATIDYKANMEDERFQQSDEKFDQRETDLEQTYAGMIGDAENIYQPQIDALEEWGNKQAQLQQERTDLTVEQIEQQKAQANKDYQKEQSGAYVDWRKQSNQYGTEAEKMASSGLMGTGYSESSQVSMYNTYQNRAAQARESYDRVIMNYNNSINEAKLQNNSALAEIAFNTLSKQLELITEGTMYKNSLILDLADKKLQVQQMRDNEYYKILDQINTENAMAQSDRQFYESQEFEAEQNRLQREFQASENELNRQFEERQAALDRQFEEAQAALDRQHDYDLLAAKTKAEKELADHNHKIAMAELEQKLANDKKLLQKELENEKAILYYQWQLEQKNKSTSFSSGSGGSSGKTTSTKSTKSTGGSSFGTSGSSTSSKSVNTDSVLALGQGPISAQNLAKQVASGKVSATEKDGEIVVSYNYPSINPAINPAGAALKRKYGK